VRKRAAKIVLTDKTRLHSGFAAAALTALCVVAVTGCGGVAKSATNRVESASKAARPPRQARRLRPSTRGFLRPGTRVSNRFAGIRAFANPGDGFAIGSPPRNMDTYPLATRDGGKTWRTAGPVLHIPAAQAAVAVAQAGMISPRIWFACCGLNGVVDVTPDAGKHWWQAFFPGEVLTVYPGPSACGRLIAVVQAYSTRLNPPLWTYASSQGRRWTHAANPNAKLSVSGHC
jgi:hypothetical protein